jgi:hypothetical protein
MPATLEKEFGFEGCASDDFVIGRTKHASVLRSASLRTWT